MNINRESSSAKMLSATPRKPAFRSSNEDRRNESLGLSIRQEQILSLVSQGHRNRAIANKLGLSENTVCTHLKYVFKKLCVSSRTEAVIRYMAFKITSQTLQELS